MELGILLVATGGERYTKFVRPLVDSLRAFLPPCHVILFTDANESFGADYRFFQRNLGWPRATLMRYHAMVAQQSFLSRYGQLFYMDVDMLACSPVEGEEIFSNGITAVTHPSYVTSFERRPESAAYVEGDSMYSQGCLVGGNAKAFLRMCEVIAQKVDIDDSHDIVALWHDESHLNHYLKHNPPAKVLSPAYCFPDPKYLVYSERWLHSDPATFVPKFRHIEKLDQGKWKDV